MEATNDPQPLPLKDQPPALTASPRAMMRESLRESGAAFVETVKALKAADRFGPTERGQAMELLCYTTTRMQAAMLEVVLGRVPASPEDCMDLLTFPVLRKAEALRRMKIVAEVTGKDIEDPILWLARLQRGAKLSVTQNLMWRMIGAKLLDEIPPPPKPPKDERALSNAQPIIDALEQGRNVILMGYHGNMPPIMGPIESYLRDKGIPRIIVGNNVNRAGHEGLFVNPLDPDFVLKFDKVAKTLKAGGPHLVTICPDGGKGASFRRFELAGAYATLGLGAATLAYFGKAACFVCLPRPSGARRIAQYFPGYDVQATDSKETVEDRITEAYREGFLETLRGDPAAFDLWEGYWAVLFRERGAPNGPGRVYDGSGQTEGHPMSLDLIRDSLTAGPEAFVATITALKTTNSFGVAERRHALGLLPHSEAPLEPRMVQEVLGCVPTSPEEAMPLMTFPVLPDAEAERRLRIVERAIGQSIDDRAGWIGRLQHGAKLYSVRSLLNRMIRDNLLPAIAPAPKRPREAAYESNANAVTEALAAGRNVILMGYHGNSPPMLGPINRYIADHQIPTIIVGNAAERRTPPGGLYIHTLAPDFVVQFAKVAKALKTGGPRVITIMPDGGIGGSFRTFDLTGVKARMGLGAASLAFFGKAKGFLCHPHMVGDRIACRYLPCLDVSAEDSKEAVSDHLTAAYRDGFISLLRGDPACFGLAGNYWSILYRPED